MRNALETSPAEIQNLRGAERADALFRTEVIEVSMTLGQTKDRMRDLMQEVNGDEEAEVRVRELMVGMNHITHGHDNVQLEEMEHHIGGVNYQVGTQQTAINSEKITAETVLDEVEQNKLRGVVLHENSVDVGHAGQIPGIQTIVDNDGLQVNAVTQYEGNVEHKVREEVGDRDDRPQDVYGEGLTFVENVGADQVNDYIRKDGAHAGDRVWMQTHIMQQSALDPQQMQEALMQAGFSQDEVFQIVVGARSGAEDALQQPQRMAA